MGSGERPIVVGGMQDFPPYEFLDEEGQPTGFNVELTRAIANVMEMDVEIRLDTWDAVRRELLDGGVDALQGMNFHESRTLTIDFSPPHSVVQYAIWARKDGAVVESLADLKDAKVIVLQSSISHDLLLENGEDQQFVFVQSYGDGLRMLATGKYEYMVAAKLPVQALVTQLRLRNVTAIKNVASIPYSYAVKKGNLAFLGRFSEGLAILQETGEYQEIYHRWLGVLEEHDAPWKTFVRYALPVILLLLASLAVTVLWSRMLTRKVAQKTADLAFEVAEKERAMKELREHQQQLIQADKMASLGILVAGVGHEINNPVGGILLGLPTMMKAYEMAADNLDQRYRESGDFMIGGLRYSLMREEVPQLYEEMMQGAGRIKRIVEDLKDFSRTIDPTCTTPLELNTIVKTSVRLSAHTIKKSTDNFIESYSENLPRILGCSQRLEQVVINLIINACQALEDCNQGIKLRTYIAGAEVRLDVSDEGVGIAPENLAHLSDPFFTTKRDVGGTGLGLSISSGIVKEHGGELRFRSTPGEGTVVTLALPVAKEETA